MADTFPTAYARTAGVLLLLSMVAGFFGEMYVPAQILGGDAATTADRLRMNDGLFRLGFAAYLVEAFCDVVLAWIFYILLRPVHRDLALLSAFFGLVSMLVFAVTKMFYFAAPTFVRGGAHLTAIPPEQLDALASQFVLLYASLSGLSFLFYGAAWIIRGALALRAAYFPRLLGLLMIAAGAGFAAKTLTHVLAPAWSADFLLAPMFVNALALTIWFLFRGIDRDRWKRPVREHDAG